MAGTQIPAETELINAGVEHETDPHNSELQSRYNEAHKALQSLITTESNKNWQAFCTGLHKQKDVSKICISLLGKKTCNLSALRKQDGSYTETPKETLELLSTTLHTSDAPNVEDLAPCESNTTLEDINSIISISRLDEAILQLKKNKCPEHDSISNEMLIEAYEIIEVPLLNIMKLSLIHAQVPTAWQTANSAILSKPAKMTTIMQNRSVL